MSWETVRYDVNDGVATVTLNRPEQWNAQLARGLSLALDAADNDDAVRSVVLTGAGRASARGRSRAGQRHLRRHRLPGGLGEPRHLQRAHSIRLDRRTRRPNGSMGPKSAPHNPDASRSLRVPTNAGSVAGRDQVRGIAVARSR
jgi:1,4-dihydroxy-2-naphthoyl-CoA synthase